MQTFFLTRYFHMSHIYSIYSVGLHHFLPSSVAFTLAEGHKVSGKQESVGFFAHSLLMRMKSNV